jgi:tRNA A37 threonylcarbamoyladenosine dehydratase
MSSPEDVSISHDFLAQVLRAHLKKSSTTVLQIFSDEKIIRIIGMKSIEIARNI